MDDNGGCLGVTDFNSCWGIVQSPWGLTHLLAPFTS
jgi:hypothetical protein